MFLIRRLAKRIKDKIRLKPENGVYTFDVYLVPPDKDQRASTGDITVTENEQEEHSTSRPNVDSKANVAAEATSVFSRRVAWP